MHLTILSIQKVFDVIRRIKKYKSIFRTISIHHFRVINISDLPVRGSVEKTERSFISTNQREVGVSSSARERTVLGQPVEKLHLFMMKKATAFWKLKCQSQQHTGQAETLQTCLLLRVPLSSIFFLLSDTLREVLTTIPQLHPEIIEGHIQVINPDRNAWINFVTSWIAITIPPIKGSRYSVVRLWDTKQTEFCSILDLPPG